LTSSSNVEVQDQTKGGGNQQTKGKPENIHMTADLVWSTSADKGVQTNEQNYVVKRISLI
jgi:hypothetical protein